MTEARLRVAGLVLAGAASQRMRGVDKACLPCSPGGPEPAMLQVRCTLLPTLAPYLQQGGGIRGWLAFDDAMAFFNVNDPASLLQLQRSLRGEGKQSG